MKGGVDLQRYLDILVPDAAKFKIISGTGPVTLVGSHCVDFYDYRLLLLFTEVLLSEMLLHKRIPLH